MEHYVPMNPGSIPAPDHHDQSGHRQSSTGTSESGQGKAHQCHICNKKYERRDHLSRHIKSHNEIRNHLCPECGKGFHRGDLLTRHRTVHQKDVSADTQRRRTSKACQSCISAKTKCDEERPCARCRSRNEPCLTTQARVRTLDKSSGRVELPPIMNTGIDHLKSADYSPAHDTVHNAGLMAFQDSYSDPATAYDQLQFPDFFDQIMNMPTLPANCMQEPLMAPPNVSTFTADDLSLMDFDFKQLARGFTRPSTAQGTGQDTVPSESVQPSPQSNAQLRSGAFDKSDWGWNRWIPNKTHATFSGHELNATEQRVNADDQLTPGSGSYTYSTLESEARDRILRLVTSIGASRLRIASFPSLELLNDLLNVFILSERESIDSYIHWPDCRNLRTETLLAVLAKGATFVALEPVWRIGLVFQEVVRMAVAEMFETDNSTTRQLQPVQAYILYLGIGLWSGFRRQTEIAMGFLQPAVTMLSWSDAFTKFRYKDIEPNSEDDATANQTKWKAWVEQESLKRLVLRVFLHDSQASLAHMKDPILSPSRMQLPIPCSVDLWRAQDAESWRTCFLSSDCIKQSELPSVLSIIADIRVLHERSCSVDQAFSTLLACHLMAYDVLQHRQQATVLANNAGNARRDRWLSHANRQREIYGDLSQIHTYCDMLAAPNPEAVFLLHYLMMLLHTPFEDLQLFSGRSGEAEARRVYPLVKAWTEDGESRTAIWHAGQALRAARSFEQTKLREFYAVILHHVALTLWVYGMVTSNVARTSRGHTPTREPTAIPSRPRNRDSIAQHDDVILDGEDSRQARAFTHFGHGRPCLSRPEEHLSHRDPAASHASAMTRVCPLDYPKSVMQLASRVLESNFPNSCSGLPPLVDNLVKLMNELSRFSGRDAG